MVDKKNLCLQELAIYESKMDPQIDVYNQGSQVLGQNQLSWVERRTEVWVGSSKGQESEGIIKELAWAEWCSHRWVANVCMLVVVAYVEWEVIWDSCWENRGNEGGKIYPVL